MALVEIAEVADGGCPLCQACYKCEGDAPLVFKAYYILLKLKTVIREEDEDFSWTLLQDALKQGAALMKKEQDNFDAAIDAAEILVAGLKAQLDEATVNFEQADPYRQDDTAAWSSKRQRLGGCTNALEKIRGQVSAEVLEARLAKKQR
jgi:hypothetical protein